MLSIAVWDCGFPGQARIQLRVSHALGENVVQNLKLEHAAWIAVFNATKRPWAEETRPLNPEPCSKTVRVRGWAVLRALSAALQCSTRVHSQCTGAHWPAPMSVRGLNRGQREVFWVRKRAFERQTGALALHLGGALPLYHKYLCWTKRAGCGLSRDTDSWAMPRKTEGGPS
jgi:hypothetical protein